MQRREQRRADAAPAPCRRDPEVAQLGAHAAALGRDREGDGDARSGYTVVVRQPDEPVVGAVDEQRERVAERRLVGAKPLISANASSRSAPAIVRHSIIGRNLTACTSPRSALRFPLSLAVAASRRRRSPRSAAVTQRQGASVPGGKSATATATCATSPTRTFACTASTAGRPTCRSCTRPNFATLFKNGKSVQTKDLKPGTPVHVEFTQSLGVRKAYKIFVADPNGHGLYGFKS